MKMQKNDAHNNITNCFEISFKLQNILPKFISFCFRHNATFNFKKNNKSKSEKFSTFPRHFYSPRVDI